MKKVLSILLMAFVISAVGLKLWTHYAGEQDIPEVATTSSTSGTPHANAQMRQILKPAVLRHVHPVTNPVRNEAPQPLPPDNTPWSVLVHDLIARAATGEAAAAQRLYADTMHCKSFLSAEITAETHLASSVSTTDMSGANAELYGTRLGSTSGILDRYGKLCDGVTDADLNEHIYSILKYAAIAGNESAASCYVIAPYPVKHELRNDPAALDDYRSNALRFVGAGIRKGDWAMLDAIAASYGEGIQPPTWQNELVAPDPLAFYAYVRVELLGADLGAVDAISNRLQAIKEENQFTAEQADAADSWASDVYSKYFVDKPSFSGHASYCGTANASEG